MANNRLYLVDTETERKFLLAKSLGDGWYIPNEEGLAQRLQAWLDEAMDFEAQQGVFPGEPIPSNLVIKTEYELDE